MSAEDNQQKKPGIISSPGTTATLTQEEYDAWQRSKKAQGQQQGRYKPFTSRPPRSPGHWDGMSPVIGSAAAETVSERALPEASAEDKISATAKAEILSCPALATDPEPVRPNEMSVWEMINPQSLIATSAVAIREVHLEALQRTVRWVEELNEETRIETMNGNGTGSSFEKVFGPPRDDRRRGLSQIGVARDNVSPYLTAAFVACVNNPDKRRQFVTTAKSALKTAPGDFPSLSL